MLAGLFPLEREAEDRWPWAGAWYVPVGDSFQVGVACPEGPPYLVTRNVERATGGHSGADLSNRTPDGRVRAAANGLVVLAGTGEDPGGFGVHVVLAHRLTDGSLAYSVYAHLAEGSVAVRVGDAVSAGQPIARVGRTGRATSPHLHFEVRLPADATQRWEKAAPVDPVAFVGARLPACARDTSWARPWRLWAESGALAAAATPGDAPATRGEWWCTLAAALALGDDTPRLDPAGARARLETAGLTLKDRQSADPIAIAEIAADIGRLAHLGWRLPAAPLRHDALAEEQERRLGSARALRDAARVAGPAAPVSRAALCLLLAGLAPEPARAPHDADPGRRAGPD